MKQVLTGEYSVAHNFSTKCKEKTDPVDDQGTY